MAQVSLVLLLLISLALLVSAQDGVNFTVPAEAPSGDQPPSKNPVYKIGDSLDIAWNSSDTSLQFNLVIFQNLPDAGPFQYLPFSGECTTSRQARDCLP